MKFTVPKKAYYDVSFPDGTVLTLLLEIGREYTIEELALIAKEQE